MIPFAVVSDDFLSAARRKRFLRRNNSWTIDRFRCDEYKDKLSKGTKAATHDKDTQKRQTRKNQRKSFSVLTSSNKNLFSAREAFSGAFREKSQHEIKRTEWEKGKKIKKLQLLSKSINYLLRFSFQTRCPCPWFRSVQARVCDR